MKEYVTIAIDTLGGDNGSVVVVKGAVEAVNSYNDIKVILVGKETELKKELGDYKYDNDRIQVVNATEEITCHDAPVSAIRAKKDSSMVIALNLVKKGEADAFISSGSSGAILVGGQLIVGRVKGIERTPLAPLLPTIAAPSLLIDCGANVDARASHLVQFAKMGSIYMKNVMGIESPKVAIVNIGTEEEKGNALVKETFPLLKECNDINFIGSIEARNIPLGEADVIVCEAFVGNVILKLYEGVGSALIGEIKGAMMSNTVSKIGAVLAKKSLKKTLSKFNASDKGGAPLLGLKGLVVKIHGNAKESEVKSAIAQCRMFVNKDISGQIIKSIEAKDKVN